MDYAIEAEGLSKSFDTLTALDDINLKIKKDEIFGLVGPDAAGKTTLLRILSGVITHTKGNALILGLDIDREVEKIKERVGYMPQRFSLYPDLTVSENIDFYAQIYDVPKNIFTKRKKELLEFTRLAPYEKRLASQLSGGMKQKLALAATLINTPEVILLDEPSTGVDPVSRREFWRILYSMPNMTIVVSTPYMDEAERCTRIGFLFKGKLLAVDTPANIKRKTSSKSLEEAFVRLIEGANVG